MYKSDAELLAAIQKLEQNILHCSPYDVFGHNNVSKINLMIEVIKMNRSLVWINSTFLISDEMFRSQPDNVMWQVAVDARSWLDNEIELEDLLFPEPNRKAIEQSLYPDKI